jgi:hypothetical protein
MVRLVLPVIRILVFGADAAAVIKRFGLEWKPDSASDNGRRLRNPRHFLITFAE